VLSRAYLALRIEALGRERYAIVRLLEDEQAHIFDNGWMYALLACLIAYPAPVLCAAVVLFRTAEVKRQETSTTFKGQSLN
jgi:hypothetical protein